MSKLLRTLISIAWLDRSHPSATKTQVDGGVNVVTVTEPNEPVAEILPKTVKLGKAFRPETRALWRFQRCGWCKKYLTEPKLQGFQAKTGLSNSLEALASPLVPLISSD